MTELELVDALRTRIIGGLHVGNIKAGDRFLSIRDTARETGLDHRAVARVVAQLAEEGLLEIRERAGVFVAAPEWVGGVILAETARWIASVVAESRRHQLSLALLAELMRCLAESRLTAACVESTDDHLVAFTSELERDFGIVAHPVKLSANATAEQQARLLEREIAKTDLVVTTAFHAGLTGPIAMRLKKPFVAVSVSPAMRDEIHRRLHADQIRAVVIGDPQFAERIRTYMTGPAAARVEVIVAPRATRQLAELRADPRVLFTRAACRNVDIEEAHLLTGDIPFIGPESAQQIAEIAVRLCLAESAR